MQCRVQTGAISPLSAARQPHRVSRREFAQASFSILMPTRATRPDRPTRGARKAVDKAGYATAPWRARLPALPAATPQLFDDLKPDRLTYPPRRNMISSIRGNERRVAGFKSESRPASSESASCLSDCAICGAQVLINEFWYNPLTRELCLRQKIRAHRGSP